MGLCRSQKVKTGLGGLPPIHCIAPRATPVNFGINEYSRMRNWVKRNGLTQFEDAWGDDLDDALIAFRAANVSYRDYRSAKSLKMSRVVDNLPTSWAATRCSRWAVIGSLYCSSHAPSHKADAGIPPVHCCRMNQKTGLPCGRWALKGSNACFRHNKGGMKMAEVRLTLAQLLSADPRPVWMTLIDAVASADALLLHAREEIKNSPVDEDGNITLDPDNYMRLMEATDRAAKLSKVAIDANISERMTQQFEAEGKLLAVALNAALDAVLPGFNLTPDQELEARHSALQAGQKNLLSTMKRDEREFVVKRDETSTKLFNQIEDLRASAREEYTGGAVIDMDK